MKVFKKENLSLFFKFIFCVFVFILLVFNYSIARDTNYIVKNLDETKDKNVFLESNNEEIPKYNIDIIAENSGTVILLAKMCSLKEDCICKDTSENTHLYKLQIKDDKDKSLYTYFNILNPNVYMGQSIEVNDKIGEIYDIEKVRLVITHKENIN